ncbi:MAG: MBL fold metallo-hydrolase, partial [Nitrospirota bacterium]|nr:MBL fold metallo-hydrolase [Nitrospirota bacterium]
IIIAASGMCDAGRIRHHLRNNLWRRQATVLFVGYQAPGTLGSLILNGEEAIQIHGKEVAVKARIRRIGNYSAHADQKELVAWVTERLPVHSGIFLTHGEDHAREVLREHLIEAGCDGALIYLPQLDDRFVLEAAKRPAPEPAKPRVEKADMETDWYNDYAALLLKLGRELEAMPKAERRDLLRRMQAQLRT